MKVFSCHGQEPSLGLLFCVFDKYSKKPPKPVVAAPFCGSEFPKLIMYSIRKHFLFSAVTLLAVIFMGNYKFNYYAIHNFMCLYNILP